MSRYVLTRFRDGLELAGHVAQLWLEFIESRREATICSIALSGGRISTALYQSFVREALRRELGNVHFFWADERCVPPDHPYSNFRGAQINLLEPLGIPRDRVHRIKGELPPPAAAIEATKEIVSSVPGLPLPQLDLVILGMGEDGHVASLFPSNTQCEKPADVYCPVKGPKPPPDRVTLSYTMIGSAREVWVLVSGSGKGEALRDSLAPAGKTPLARVIQNRSATRVFTEEATFA